MRSAGIEWVDRRAVVAEARALAARMCAAHPEIERVVLIGSFARGGGGPRSDLDLVAFVRSTPLAPRDRPARYRPVHPRPLDLTVYTADEARALAAGGPPPILREALERGVHLAP